ncbi:glycoside hydrolase family 13 protein [Agromyces silvae]|uniref:glycoside hydrolase family 13 protein n=1 Tax=Agromyces silvae TaxID=3388266 RepID=UPI00280AB2A7|nr:glycoside hydrolase family 13 protein [Agromyces protaetiae]
MSSNPSTTVEHARRGDANDPTWWRQAVVYQVYPRSFADSNGDGIGDLRGVRSRVEYLASLGVDAVWLSPFYPSALTDGGYDVDDYRDVDPTLGTLEDFDALVDELHRHGIKIIVDIVPNHSSDRHAWFQEALAAGRGSPARDRYLFREGRGANGELPPTDWSALFGGSAWTRVDDGQWYLGLFTPNQPDWNWKHPEVREDFLRTLRFWGDRGVDGFRVDVAMGLAKDLRDPLPSWEMIAPGLAILKGLVFDDPFAEGQHPLFDRDEVHDIYAEWRTVFDRYSPPLFAVAEAWVAPHRRVRYASADSLGQAFNFDLLTAPWSARDVTAIVQHNLDLAARAGSSSTWVFSNHDVVRHATRLGLPDAADTRRIDAVDAEVGLQRATAATLLALALPGSAYLYQGEELGLPEVTDIPAEQWQDPMAHLVDGVVVTRDGCRVPLPWTTHGVSFGFGNHAPHLPQPEWFGSLSVEAQTGAEGSTLSLYRAALRIRGELQADETVVWLDLGDDVLAFSRSTGWTSITNFGASAVPLPPGRVLVSSLPLTPDGELPGNATVWLQTESEER